MYTLCGGDVTEKYKNEQLHCYGMINITVLLPVQLHYWYMYNHKSTENPVSTRYKKM
jgi:hypothetical protein